MEGEEKKRESWRCLAILKTVDTKQLWNRTRADVVGDDNSMRDLKISRTPYDDEVTNNKMFAVIFGR